MPQSVTQETNKQNNRLPDIWLKAAMLGSLWASVEIILGSFLHNLHIPFSGTFLSSLGVILMINGYKLWPQEGLFWRTALVTAAMKSISPSAIIFGPMVGIFMEGVILEAFLRLFRKKWLGFVLGGAFAVTWSLFQKVFVLLLTYGSDFVSLYERLYFMASKSMGIPDTVPFDLVKIIFLVDLSYGALVAALAYRTAGVQKALSYSPGPIEAQKRTGNRLIASTQQNYSLILFLVNLIVLVGGLTLLDDFSALSGAAFVAIYVGLNIVRYSRSLNRLKRPKLWIQLFFIMGLSGLILGGWSSQEALLSGIETGFAMATRAMLVIFGFSALSIEIRNPVIIGWFTQRGMGILFESLSVAFEVLPRLMKMVSERQQIWRHPFRILNELLGSLEVLRREHQYFGKSKVIILTGEQGDGKTELIKNLIARSAESDRFSFVGFYTEGVWLNGERDEYHTVDIKTQESELLCERSNPVSQIRSGPFNFREQGIKLGCKSLESTPSEQANHIVIIDEIGHLELRGQGWGACMTELVGSGRPMIWTVRPSLVERVTEKWDIDFCLLHVNSTSPKALEARIESFLF